MKQLDLPTEVKNRVEGVILIHTPRNLDVKRLSQIAFSASQSTRYP